MRITLNIGEILFDVAEKSHAECLVAFPDPEERYGYEAGTDRRDAVMRCVETALAETDAALEELSAAPHQHVGTDEPGLSDTDAVVYDFPGSARRLSSQASAIARLLHSAVVARTLALFDASLGRTDAAQGWAAIAETHTSAAVNSLHTKTKPVRAKPYTV